MAKVKKLSKEARLKIQVEELQRELNYLDRNYETMKAKYDEAHDILGRFEGRDNLIISQLRNEIEWLRGMIGLIAVDPKMAKELEKLHNNTNPDRINKYPTSSVSGGYYNGL